MRGFISILIVKQFARARSANAMKIRFLLLAVSFLFLSTISGQYVKSGVMKKFLGAPELYVVRTQEDMEFINSHGDTISLISLANKYWPQKTIIDISAIEYDALENVDDLFHITISIVNVEGEDGGRSYSEHFHRLKIQRGETGYKFAKIVYFFLINFPDIQNNFLAERLEYGVMNLRDKIYNFKDKSKTEGRSYKIDGLKEILARNNIV